MVATMELRKKNDGLLFVWESECQFFYDQISYETHILRVAN